MTWTEHPFWTSGDKQQCERDVDAIMVRIRIVQYFGSTCTVRVRRAAREGIRERFSFDIGRGARGREPRRGHSAEGRRCDARERNAVSFRSARSEIPPETSARGNERRRRPSVGRARRGGALSSRARRLARTRACNARRTSRPRRSSPSPRAASAGGRSAAPCRDARAATLARPPGRPRTTSSSSPRASRSSSSSSSASPSAARRATSTSPPRRRRASIAPAGVGS